MKRLLVLLSLAMSACGVSKPPSPPPSPPPPDQMTIAALAHKVAEIEINVARLSLAANESPSGPNHPQMMMLGDMAAIHIGTVNWRSLPADQLALLRDVASRIATAKSGYEAGGMPCGLAGWDPSVILEAAYSATTGPSSDPDDLVQPDLAAALALKEIEESRTIQDFKTQCVR
jgi:hypothetical protein